MSQCPPQAFYMLVPILFDQSVLACRSNVLSIETMRGGLEFLLEPFLLPSLVGGISWLVKHSWEDHDDADILLQMLEKLLKPSGSSQDMQAMHRCILGIVSTPLVSSLQTLISRRPEKSDQANALITILRSVGPVISTRRSCRSRGTGPTLQSASRMAFVSGRKSGSLPASNSACRRARAAINSRRCISNLRESLATKASACGVRMAENSDVTAARISMPEGRG